MRLSMPKPCPEKWEDMAPDKEGAFCSICAKTVVDFTRMSNGEILSYFQQKGKEKVCGRFTDLQMAPYKVKVDIRQIAGWNFPKVFAATAFIFFTTLFVCRADTGTTLKVTVSYVWTDKTDSVKHVPPTDTGYVQTVTDFNGEVVFEKEGMDIPVTEHPVQKYVEPDVPVVVEEKKDVVAQEVSTEQPAKPEEKRKKKKSIYYRPTHWIGCPAF